MGTPPQQVIICTRLNRGIEEINGKGFLRRCFPLFNILNCTPKNKKCRNPTSEVKCVCKMICFLFPAHAITVHNFLDTFID